MSSKEIAILPGWNIPDSAYHALIYFLKERGFKVQIVQLPCVKNIIKARSWLLSNIPQNGYIIGHSLGGQWALEVSDQVNSVFCITTNPCFIGAENNLGVKEKDFNLLEKLFNENTESALKFFKRQLLKNSSIDIQPQVKGNTIAGLQHLRQLNSYDKLSNNADKCTMWFAKEDALIPFAIADHVKNNFNVDVITNSGGHLPMLEHSKKLFEKIFQWLIQ